MAYTFRDITNEENLPIPNSNTGITSIVKLDNDNSFKERCNCSLPEISKNDSPSNAIKTVKETAITNEKKDEIPQNIDEIGSNQEYKKICLQFNRESTGTNPLELISCCGSVVSIPNLDRNKKGKLNELDNEKLNLCEINNDTKGCNKDSCLKCIIF